MVLDVRCVRPWHLLDGPRVSEAQVASAGRPPAARVSARGPSSQAVHKGSHAALLAVAHMMQRPPPLRTHRFWHRLPFLLCAQVAP